MINVIVNAIFYVVTKLFDIVMTPFITAITALFPSVGTYFLLINRFLSTALQYSTFVMNVCLVPRGVIVTLLDYIVIKYSIFLLVRAIQFVIRVYNTLKP